MADEKLLIKIWPFNQIHCKAHHVNFWKLTKSTHVELFLKGCKKLRMTLAFILAINNSSFSHVVNVLHIVQKSKSQKLCTHQEAWP